jgi:hypothetical protein
MARVEQQRILAQDKELVECEAGRRRDFGTKVEIRKILSAISSTRVVILLAP